jgi:hypothetical protein
VVAEACMLMWMLVDLNPALLAAFVSCNVEQPTLRHSGSPGMWLSILVRNENPSENLKVLMQMPNRKTLQTVGRKGESDCCTYCTIKARRKAGSGYKQH